MFAVVQNEWHGDRKKGGNVWYCVYPDGTRKLCLGEDVARELADKYNAPIAAEVAARAGGYKG